MTRGADFTLRPYTPSDAQAAVRVLNADAARTTGLRAAVVDGAGSVRLARYVPARSERVVVADTQGDVVAYAWLADRDRHIVYEAGGAVHPGQWGRRIGSQILAWAEGAAASLSARAPAGVKTALQLTVYEAETRAIRLLARHGFARVREWIHFVLEMSAPPAMAEVPGGLVLRAMDLEADWDIAGPAMDQAFSDHWGAISLPEPEAPAEEPQPAGGGQEDKTYSNSPGFCFVALDSDGVAGGILCNARLVERSGAGRVGSLFVVPRWRGRGLARALLLTAFQAFWQAGLRRVITDTDAESFTRAPALYGRLGMRPYRRELVFEKEIRPGREVRRLAQPTVETP